MRPNLSRTSSTLGEKVRVYELAREVGLPVADVLSRLQEGGIPVSSHLSAVDAELGLRILRPGSANDPKPKPPAFRRRRQSWMHLWRHGPLPPEEAAAPTRIPEVATRLLDAVDERRPLHSTAVSASKRAAARTRERLSERMPDGLRSPGEALGVETEAVGKDSGRPTWWRIAYHCRGYSLHIFGVLLLDLIAIPLFLLTPLALKIGVDSVVNSKPLPSFLDPLVPDFMLRSDWWLLMVVACLQIAVALGTQLQELTRYVLGTYTGERITLGVRSKLFAHMQRLSMLFHDSRGTTDSIYRVQYDAPALQYITVDGLVPLLTSTIMLVSMLVVIANINWQLAVIALIIAPLLFHLARSYAKKMRPRYRDLKGVETDAMKVVQEVLTALRVVKAFGRERTEHERFVHHSVESLRGRVRLAVQEGAFGLWVNLTTAAGTAAVFVVGIRGVTAGALTLGDFLMVTAYLVQLYAPLKTINATFAAVQQSLAGADRVFEMLDNVPDVLERETARPLRRAKGHIELKEVSFAYETGEPILSDISFAIQPGTRLGIFGPTGAGKSTLIGLISRFFDPTEGQILIDGVDIRDYKISDLRQQFGIVLQEPVLFSTTIAENIAFGNTGATEAQIVEAARLANIHDFIEQLPDGYATVVGERGMRLSGGERQRISLARAFVKDSPILILDEPTSSIDLRTEGEIIDAMKRLMEGRTTLMIAHRLETLQDCDMLIMVEGGRIAINPDSFFGQIDLEVAAGARSRVRSGKRHLKPVQQ